MLRVRNQIEYMESYVHSIEPVTVAVIDSGVNGNHPDLNGKVLKFVDFLHGKEVPYDDYGHGTHLCGIIGGTGRVDEHYKGIGEWVQFVALKVLDEAGKGDSENFYNALKWIEKNGEKYHIRIINISVGGISNEKIVLQRKIQVLLDGLWDRGMVIVCSAGNNGPRENTISFLGKGEKRICVGCHDGEFFRGNTKSCSYYSARGGRFLQKPDIVAPGTRIVSCNAFYSQNNPANAYVAKNGTSMATAIVTGVVANLIQVRPDLTNDELKEILLSTAKDLGEKPWIQGKGMVNYKKLLTFLV